MVVDFTLAGTPYQIINGGPMFPLSEAVSISVRTKDQAETDRLWLALIADGGAESMCGWCKDRFGLSWQIVPEPAIALLSGPSAAKVWPALMQMKKVDIAALKPRALPEGDLAAINNSFGFGGHNVAIAVTNQNATH